MGARRKRNREEQISQQPTTTSTPAVEAPQPSLPTDKCASKAITLGRWINFNFLTQEGFTIGELMKEMS